MADLHSHLSLFARYFLSDLMTIYTVVIIDVGGQTVTMIRKSECGLLTGDALDKDSFNTTHEYYSVSIKALSSNGHRQLTTLVKIKRPSRSRTDSV